jgi:hypothetical protein
MYQDHRERGQPRRAETDVDPVDPYVDPFDQGGEDSALAGHGQLGPVLADLCGPRDTPVLY